MNKERMVYFSDAVIAIIITIMVLELKVPHGAEWSALVKLTPVFLSYVLSFIYLAIYWNNHHHLLLMASRVDAAILWANMHLMFWLSLIPFATGWMGENQFARLPTALYGLALLMPAIAFYLLQRAIIRLDGPTSKLARALGNDIKGKSTMAAYTIAIGIAFVLPWIAHAMYVVVALVWLIPDRRIEATLED
jgi:uncharacterized membrane protein